MEIKEMEQALNNIYQKLIVYGGHFDIDKEKAHLKELQKETEDPSFWTVRERKDQVLSEISIAKEKIDNIEEIANSIKENLELIELMKLDSDQEIVEQIEESITNLPERLEKLNMLLLLSGPYDKNNCIIDIHSGAGGTEACDWALMLYRMYTRWCEKKSYKIEILDYQAGDEAGIKSASLLIKGPNAYGYLKNEKGVHRLVRLSPFDSNNRRHTSFASIEVTPEIEQDNSLEIDEKDLKIDVYRSSGCGGQGVNTTDSAVRITHLPTKIVVTCQNERSQIQNKEQAMKVLRNKLLLKKYEEQEKELKQIKGDQMNIEFGSQIRSYVMHPYSLVKDHRTNYETSNVSKVLDGDIDGFIEASLKRGL
ncbi:MAG: peptide chain release factor 2 [Bacilli bacterium]|nr:peptide chain release factor 2 [bacterium]MDY2696833.1 peptide chain release factor 2 [Bacilli bacterium]